MMPHIPLYLFQLFETLRRIAIRLNPLNLFFKNNKLCMNINLSHQKTFFVLNAKKSSILIKPRKLDLF